MNRRPVLVTGMLCVVMVIVPACRNDDLSRSNALPSVVVNATSTQPTDKAIATAQSKLAANRDDNEARLALAQAFLQKARETADPSLYTKADALLAGLRAHAPHNDDVLLASASLALSRHQFAHALQLGRQALTTSPDNAGAYGVVIDADNELGRYDDAMQATQELVDIRPNLSSLSRVSYARELHGDLAGAIDAMQQAVTAGTASGATGENVAYVQALLGDLLWKCGRIDDAERAYIAADASFPGFAAALAGRANIAAYRGDISSAIDLWKRVVDRQPLPAYVQQEGDALQAAGRPVEAQRAYDLVDAINRLYKANGVQVDLEAALFEADHHPGNGAVKHAQLALKERPTVFAHDVLAWNLYRSGKVTQAHSEMEKALSLGSMDPQMRYHAAVIFDASGDNAQAVKSLNDLLQTNSRFSPARTLDIADRLARLQASKA